jgi:hypothetical protein
VDMPQREISVASASRGAIAGRFRGSVAEL